MNSYLLFGDELHVIRDPSKKKNTTFLPVIY